MAETRLSEFVINQVLEIIRDAGGPIPLREILDQSPYGITAVYVATQKLRARECVTDKGKYLDKKHPHIIALIPTPNHRCEFCQ